MDRVLIWDLPTRLFHWLLAAGFAAAAVIALVLGEDSPLFPYHAILGLTISAMVVLRVVWGLVGTRYARFGSFLFGPAAVLGYFRGVLLGGGPRHAGHNPGSAYAIFAMLALVLAMAVTGFMLGQGNESVKEVHEFLAYALAVVAALHILGVGLHSVRHRENLTATMIHGRKAAETSAGISSARAPVAAAFLLITGAWTGVLLANYDGATQTVKLPAIGISLQLGESEGEDERGAQPRRDRDEDEDHD
jgi:cytochrome b